MDKSKKRVNEEYILAELSQYYEGLKHNYDQSNAKVNVYLALLSVFFAVSAVLPQFGSLQANIIQIGSCVALSIILVFGLITYAEFVQIIMYVILTNRRIGRIRRYFYEQYPDMRIYLLDPKYDDFPMVVRRRNWKDIINTDIGFKQILTILNAIVAALFSVLFTLTFVQSSLSLPTLTIIVIVSGGITLVGQMFYSRLRYKLMDEKLQIAFPLWESLEPNSLDAAEGTK